MGQRVVVGGRQRGPQGRLAVVVWRTWNEEEGEKGHQHAHLTGSDTRGTCRGETRAKVSWLTFTGNCKPGDK